MNLKYQDKTVALKTFYWITENLLVETTYSNKQFQKHADYFDITSVNTSFSMKRLLWYEMSESKNILFEFQTTMLYVQVFFKCSPCLKGFWLTLKKGIKGIFC